jgi:hypothetical protein
MINTNYKTASTLGFFMTFNQDRANYLMQKKERGFFLALIRAYKIA